MFLSIFNYSKR